MIIEPERYYGVNYPFIVLNDVFTEDECKLFKDMPSRYYTNNAVERCKVRKLINDHHEFIGNLKPNADIGFTEDGLVRVGADIGGDPFRNIS